MSRYIDADALIKENAYASDMWDRGTQSFDLPIVEVSDIENAPSIDIVRCKECVKRMREDCPMCNGCKLDRVPTEDDDFCSYGEREGE